MRNQSAVMVKLLGSLLALSAQGSANTGKERDRAPSHQILSSNRMRSEPETGCCKKFQLESPMAPSIDGVYSAVLDESGTPKIAAGHMYYVRADDEVVLHRVDYLGWVGHRRASCPNPEAILTTHTNEDYYICYDYEYECGERPFHWWLMRDPKGACDGKSMDILWHLQRISNSKDIKCPINHMVEGVDELGRRGVSTGNSWLSSADDSEAVMTCLDDIDECATSVHHCTSDSDCVNTHGGYDCVCQEGKTCDDFDQCQKNGGANCPVGSTCTDTGELTGTNKGYTCECNVGWTRNTETQECESPCPSSECWEFDNDSQTCTLKQTCMTVTCDATEMTMGFNGKIFGVEDPSKISPAPEVDSAKTNGIHFIKTCTLGECGMTYKTVNDDAELEFTMLFEPVADDARRKRREARGDDITTITLNDGIVVNMVEYSSALKFTCTYPMNVTVSSDFAVAKISLGSGMSSKGNFGEGFSLAVDKGTDSAIPLGERQTVTTTWKLTTLSKVKFHFTECNVEQGDAKVTLIKNKCYSTALKVTKMDGTNTAQSFSYKTFSTVGATGTTLTMKCTLNLCFDGTDCKLPATDGDCLKADETAYAGYRYSVSGYVDSSAPGGA
jgi:hypothetical protein